MRYYLDCEFNGFGGALLSMALIRQDGQGMYVVMKQPDHYDFWVEQNVTPYLYGKDHYYPFTGQYVGQADQAALANAIHYLLDGDKDITIIADWPDDIKYFCQGLITGPGMMINIPGIKFEMVRVDSWPNNIQGAIRHNAAWDAFALMKALS